MKEIPLTQGKVALVDDGDYEYLNQWKWRLGRRGKGNFYACRQTGRPDRKAVYMHRLISDAPSNKEVDHKDGNGLNNTRANLRICTSAQNHQNQRVQVRSVSGFKGVHFNREKNKWQAVIVVFGKRIRLGYFRDPVQAAHTYDDAAKKHFGEFAGLNFEQP